MLMQMSNPGQTVNALQNSHHQHLVLPVRVCGSPLEVLLHTSKQLHRLGQRLMTFGDSIHSFFETHVTHIVLRSTMKL